MSTKISNSAKSWITVSPDSDFPIQNIPFGTFKSHTKSPRVGSAIGDKVLDLKELYDLGYLSNLGFDSEDFDYPHLNNMMRKGKSGTRKLRERIYELLIDSNSELKDKTANHSKVLIDQSDVTMLLPIHSRDYTDFYSSEQHAYNVGCLFRDPDNALLPNWKHIPVGYHGRASSIIVSGQDIVRPKGQKKPPTEDVPSFGQSNLLDFELETVFFTYQGKPLGDTISTAEADDYIFGMALFNDWSARDIQGWEYVPLGPFLGKSFASSVSPWIVTLDALEQFRIPGPVQDPKVLPYLAYNGNKHIDIKLDVIIKPNKGEENIVGQSNYKYMYWNMNQQLAHHSVNGCNIGLGDAMGSVTISGPNEGQYGSMLEISWKGTKPFKMSDGTERKFLQDGDTVIMRGNCQNKEVRIGFGEVSSKILPAR
jgi:fumarylacetoacetase